VKGEAKNFILNHAPGNTRCPDMEVVEVASMLTYVFLVFDCFFSA
jgi:hypothetical protein